MADPVFQCSFRAGKNLKQKFLYLPALFLLSIFLFTGCGTIISYKSNAPAPAPKSADYPIPVFMADDSVPRPVEIIGAISAGSGTFTFGSEPIEKILEKMLRLAREKGADVMQITALEKPGFTSPNYRLTANLLRYADTWETMAISENELRAYLKKNARTLDPIEGIWSERGEISQQIGIVKNNARPGRDFIGFILDSQNPAWPPGTKKIDIRRGLQTGSYLFTYYLKDFEPRAANIILGRQKTFTLAIQKTDDEGDLIIYTKN